MKKILRNVRSSLCYQLIVYYLVISGAVLGAVSLLFYWYSTRLVESSNETNILQQLRQADSNIARITTDLTNVSNMFMLNEYVQQYLLGGYGNSSDIGSVEGNSHILSEVDNYLYTYNYLASVYLFTDDGREIGSDGQYTVNSWGWAADRQVLSAGEIQQANAKFPEVVPIGSRMTSDFRPQVLSQDTDEHLVSYVKKVCSVSQPDRYSMLIFNVRESYLSSLYTQVDKKQYGNIRIVTASGQIVSGVDKNQIGKQTPLAGRIRSGKAAGSFAFRAGKQSEQVVYYRMAGTGWYILDEISLKSIGRATAIGQMATVAICLIAILTVCILSYFWVWKVTRPLNLLSVKMSQVSAGHPGVTLAVQPRNEIGALIRDFNEMSVNTARLIQKNTRIQEEKTRLEIEMLQSQINPHFIYNTLNMIKWMARMIHARNIEESVVAMGRMLGPAFRDRHFLWPLSEEQTYLDSYMKISNWRFGDRIRLHLEIPEALSGQYVPKLILQPVVENSVRHGMRQLDALEVTVRVRQEAGCLRIRVEDNGCGIAPERLAEIRRSLENGTPLPGASADSVGLYNVNRRIQLNYGARYGIEIDSVPDRATTVSIRLPLVPTAANPPET